MSGYYLHCVDDQYSKKVQLFDKLDDFRDNDVKSSKHCNQSFEKNHNGRKIVLHEVVDKYILKRILDDFDSNSNNINLETQNNLKEYYKSLNGDGVVKITYKQNNDTGRYYSNKFSSQSMFNEVRTSIIHKDFIDIDFINSIVTIIMYLADQHGLKIPSIKSYGENRKAVLEKINKDRTTAIKVIIAI